MSQIFDNVCSFDTAEEAKTYARSAQGPHIVTAPEILRYITGDEERWAQNDGDGPVGSVSQPWCTDPLAMLIAGALVEGHQESPLDLMDLSDLLNESTVSSLLVVPRSELEPLFGPRQL